MNIKKIGLTALAGSLVSISAANAGALSASGAASITFSGNDAGTGGNGLSMSDTVNFVGSGEMDNGMTVTASFELDNNAVGGSGEYMDSRSIKIDTNGMGTITFAGHGGSSAMGAVDDVMPTAYGESWDLIGHTSASTSKTDGQADKEGAIGGFGTNNSFMYNAPEMVDGLVVNISYTPSGTTTTGAGTTAATPLALPQRAR